MTAAGCPAIRRTDIEVRAGLDGRVEVTLPRLESQRQEVTVTESVFIAPEEIKSSGYLITRQEISKTAGSLQDVSRYVQTLPGVAIGSNDFRNDIIVRGGSPLENLFIIYNIEIPNINGFANFASAGGTVSMLDSELIQDSHVPHERLSGSLHQSHVLGTADCAARKRPGTFSRPGEPRFRRRRYHSRRPNPIPQRCKQLSPA